VTRFFLLGSLAVAWLVVVPAAGAQTNTAEIAGVIRDAQGGVLPGATV